MPKMSPSRTQPSTLIVRLRVRTLAGLGMWAVLVFLSACAGHTAGSGPSARHSGSVTEPPALDLGGMVIRIKEDPQTGLDVYDGDQLFALGLKAFGDEDYDVAAYVFGHMIDVFPEHEDRAPATWNAGLSYEQLGQVEEAVLRFSDYLDLVAEEDGAEAAQARLRLATLLQRLERYDEILPVLDGPSAFTDYEDYELWELRSLRAIAKGAAGKFDWAESELNRVRMGIRQATRRSGDRFPYQSAMVWYLAGILDRLHARSIVFESVDDLELLDQQLGDKAELLMMARQRLKRAIEHGEPSWTGASAFALGSVYRDFRDDLLAAPPPTDLDEEQRVAYERLLRERSEEFLLAKHHHHHHTTPAKINFNFH